MIKKVIKKIIRAIDKQKWKLGVAMERGRIRAEHRNDPDRGNVLLPVILELNEYTYDGLSYLEDKEYDEAIEQFKKVISCDPKYYAGYEYLGMVYKELGLLDEARKNYGIAIGNMKRMMKESPGCVDDSLLTDIEKGLADIKG